MPQLARLQVGDALPNHHDAEELLQDAEVLSFLTMDAAEREAWEDLKAVLARLGRTPPGRAAKGQNS